MTIQKLYETILETNVINFCLMIGILMWIFKKFNLGSIIDNMQHNIVQNVTSCEDAARTAVEEYKKSRKNLKNLPLQKQDILNKTNEKILILKEKNEIEIQKKQAELERDFEKNRTVCLNKKTNNTAQQIQDAVVQLPVQTIKSMLSDELHKKIILNSLDEFDKIQKDISL